MQNNDLVKNESYSRVSASTAISSDLSLVLSEENKIVCLNGRVLTLSKELSSGRATVRARAIFNLIYSTDEGLQRYESGADFELNFLSDGLKEGVPIYLEYEVGSLRAEKTLSGVTVSAVITADALFHITVGESVLSEISGAVCKKQAVECLQYAGYAEKRFEEQGEKILSGTVERVLYSQPKATVKEVQCGINEIIVDGEVSSELVICMDGGRIESESFTTPFRYEIESEQAMPERTAVAFLEVVDANYKIIREEDSEKSVIKANYTVEICGEVYETLQKNCIQDAFFSDRELELGFQERSFCEGIEQKTILKKCFGEAVCKKNAEERVVCLVCGQMVDVNYGYEEGKTTLTCVIKCTLITQDEQKNYNSCEAELPVSLILDTKNPPLQLNLSKRSLSASENEGKIFVEGELLIKILCSENTRLSVAVEAQEGEPKAQDESAIGIIFIREGEDCWSVCKKAGVCEKTLREQNPNLDFPAESDCAVVVFRPTT